MAAGYEQLREQVLAGGSDGWRLGHAVLAGKGMVAWVGAWSTFAWAPAAGTSAPDPPQSPPSVSPSTPTPPTALSSLPGAEQLVAVLTQMALAHA